MREVAIIGAGMTRFGELWDQSLRELGIEAGLEAMVDAGISSGDVDALYTGNMSSGRFIQQEHVSALISDHTGFARYNLPSVRVEAADASGGVALREAYIAVASGVHDIVVVGGAEKMTDVSEAMANEILASGADQEWEAFLGATIPSLYALIARRHMHEYGTTREMMASVAVNAHRNGSLNPKAQFSRRITIEDVLRAPLVSDPLGRLDCAPISDGAAALVLCPLERAKEFTDSPVQLAGSGLATDRFRLQERESLTTFRSTVKAAEMAYMQADISPGDVDVAEVHDNFTISGILAVEDLGFAPKGHGGRLFLDGHFSLDGDLPVNTSGGLKAQGQPPGAIGIAQAVEVVLQLTGRCGRRQVEDPEIGLIHNTGGTGSTAVVHVLKVV